MASGVFRTYFAAFIFTEFALVPFALSMCGFLGMCLFTPLACTARVELSNVLTSVARANNSRKERKNNKETTTKMYTCDFPGELVSEEILQVKSKGRLMTGYVFQSHPRTPNLKDVFSNF